MNRELNRHTRTLLKWSAAAMRRFLFSLTMNWGAHGRDF